MQSLAALDPKTRWAEVEPLLDAAMLLASGDTVLADRVAWEAFRFQHYARARAALDLVSPAARTAWNRLHRVFVCLVLEDRAGIAVELATLDAISLAPAERHLADVHRAWAAFRLETPGEPTFTMDRQRVAEVVGEVRPTGPRAHARSPTPTVSGPSAPRHASREAGSSPIGTDQSQTRETNHPPAAPRFALPASTTRRRISSKPL